MSRKLTDKQKQFVIEYLVDLNATQAAIRAGYSENSAKEIGCENLTKPHISEQIQEEMRKRSERVKLEADEVLKGILDIRNNAMQLIDYTKGIKNKETGEYEQVKVADDMMDRHAALKASELLGKHLKIFTEVIDHNIKEIPKINIVRGKQDE